MTPKEKAKELISEYFRLLPQKEFITEEGGLKWNEWDNREHLEIAKQCALICVEKIIEVLNGNHIFNAGIIEYWLEVKKEIEEYGK